MHAPPITDLNQDRCTSLSDCIVLTTSPVNEVSWTRETNICKTGLAWGPNGEALVFIRV